MAGSEKVKCDHCKNMVNKNEVEKTEWKEYNLVWYHCKKCIKCFKK